MYNKFIHVTFLHTFFFSFDLLGKLVQFFFFFFFALLSFVFFSFLDVIFFMDMIFIF